jgi:hypothetical protein
MTRISISAMLVVIALSFFVTLEGDLQLARAVDCDNKCRMRQYFTSSVGQGCYWTESEDCLVCRTSECYPNDPPVPDGNTCFVTTFPQRLRSKTSCTPKCPHNPCDAAPFALEDPLEDAGSGVWVCPLYNPTPPG